VKHAVLHGIWVPTQHLLESGGKPRKVDRAGRLQGLPDANRLMVSSPAFKYTNPDIGPCLCCLHYFETFYRGVFFFVYVLRMAKSVHTKLNSVALVR
jgi:hypothetical protein